MISGKGACIFQCQIKQGLVPQKCSNYEIKAKMSIKCKKYVHSLNDNRIQIVVFNQNPNQFKISLH